MSDGDVSTMLVLPCGMAMMEVEGGLVKAFYTDGMVTQFYEVGHDKRISVRHYDQIEICYHDERVQIGASYTYDLRQCRLDGFCELGVPEQESYLRTNDERDYLPDIYQLMCRNERLPKSMWKFLQKR